MVLAAGMASCVFDDPRSDAQRLVDDFVAELNDRDAAGAAALTSYPNAAETSIRQLFEGMKDGDVEFDVAQFVELNEQTGF
ncbi:NTF2-like N-terminal transpeptidase domain-containing protein, partial [Rhodococcus ruber]